MDIRLKNKDKSAYSNLKSKIYARFLLLTAAAIVIVTALYRLLWKTRGGDVVVDILLRTGLDSTAAASIYQRYFRNFTDIIWIAAVTLIFLVMLRFFMSWFTKYFTSINKGIDALLVEDDNKILLPPEMAATEDTLNTVKDTLRQRKRAANEAEKRKNDLITYLAHDIHTPLTSVIGYLSLLKEADVPKETADEYVQIALDKSLRLEKLINEFFEITRYNLQEITLDKRDTDIYYMLLQLTDEFYPVFKQHGNSIELNADENLSGRVDAEKLARVFSNILRNAVSYGYAGTPVTINAARDGGVIVISVSSHGKTIPKAKLGALFEKFFRADDARATNTGGAGLGLAVAKQIVTLHGGTISAESEDEVTTFTVRIPA